PSVLRTHPPTAQRVERLMRLKADAGVALPPDATIIRPAALDRPPQHRRSVVPSVGSRSPRLARELDEIAGHLAATPRGLVDVGDDPASADHIRLPEGNPRIRIRRGGVYW